MNSIQQPKAASVKAHSTLERVWKVRTERERSPLAVARTRLSRVLRPGTGRAPVSQQHFPNTLLGRLAVLSLALTLCAGLCGCSFLKPAQSTARHYVLAPLSQTGPSPARAGCLAVGLGQVKLAAYLFDTSLAIRKSTNEISYLPSDLWAERLDAGFQRTLAANLATLLPTDRLLVSTWQKDDVVVEVYVAVEQLDVDTEGQGVLVARWRLLPPGGDKILKSGRSRLVRQGPPPGAGAAGTVATLSELVADFSRQLSKALQDSNPGAQTK